MSQFILNSPVWGGSVLAVLIHRGEISYLYEGRLFCNWKTSIAGRLDERGPEFSTVNALEKGAGMSPSLARRSSPIRVSLHQGVRVVSGHSLPERRLESIMSKKFSADAGRCSKINDTRRADAEERVQYRAGHTGICCQGRGEKARDRIWKRRLRFTPLSVVLLSLAIRGSLDGITTFQLAGSPPLYSGDDESTSLPFCRPFCFSVSIF